MSVKYRLTLQLFIFTAFRCMSVCLCPPYSFILCIEVDDDGDVDEVYLVEEDDHKMKHLKQALHDK